MGRTAAPVGGQMSLSRGQLIRRMAAIAVLSDKSGRSGLPNFAANRA